MRWRIRESLLEGRGIILGGGCASTSSRFVDCRRCSGGPRQRSELSAQFDFKECALAEARVRVKYQWLAASWRRRLLLDAEMSQNWEVETQDDQGRRRSAPIGSALNNVSVLLWWLAQGTAIGTPNGRGSKELPGVGAVQGRAQLAARHSVRSVAGRSVWAGG